MNAQAMGLTHRRHFNHLPRQQFQAIRVNEDTSYNHLTVLLYGELLSQDLDNHSTWVLVL
jgi:hypothetical protein